MSADYKPIQQRIQAFDFKGLFTQELMWNHLQTRELQIPADGVTYILSPVAERGMAVYICVPPSDAAFPKYSTRRKIDVQVSKTAREHIIIFHDAAKTVQIWQWVKKEAGKASACREQIYYAGQSADALTQKIQGIQFSLDDEPSVLETRARVGAAFDVEKVTKKFYEQFKKEHDAFLKFIKGIPDEHLQRWYVSVMLNRLMFIYFIQKKGFLAGDQNYLASRLAESKRRGKDLFYSKFLCPLFFEGFAKREEQRSPEMNRLLGRIPYLNGGLFLKHQIEELHGEKIEVPDRAFERIIEFFEQYDWHLDDRPTHTGREINPDVLGYVFEKYINQKEMGAYYTKEDITGYISQNTIIPALFDMARKSCRIAFEGEHSVWRLLQQDPDRYIYPTMLHGVDEKLPANIAQGIADVSKRADWNKTASPELGLPTETWREAVARRERCSEIRKKLAAAEIRDINDLITHNLDIRRFAEEVIANAEGPDLLRAFYTAIAGNRTKSAISVLDPACGSGAFLFAALNILERLHDSCLSRMQAFVDDLERSNQKRSLEKYKDFRGLLSEMNDKARHPSPRYFILKSIILNNLYGVDIMEEAAEICKLRLFLKLVAQVNPGEKIEPLPDIDFNILAGNTLVGYGTEGELDKALSRLGHAQNKADITEKAEAARKAIERFRDQQITEGTGQPLDLVVWKNEVHHRLGQLRDELDDYLAGDYNIKKGDVNAFAGWRASHQPFHWVVEFYAICSSGGFDVIIGNPPFVEMKDVAAYALRGYATESCSNLFAYFVERASILSHAESRISMIIPLSAFSTDRMVPLIDCMKRSASSLHIANFGWRPGKLFDGVNLQLSIFLQQRGAGDPKVFSTMYTLWDSIARPELFFKLEFSRVNDGRLRGSVPKIGTGYAASILTKIRSLPGELGECIVRNSSQTVYYRRGGLYWKVFVSFETGSSEEKLLPVRPDVDLYAVIAILSSDLWFWYFTATSDCRHLGNRDINTFPVSPTRMTGAVSETLAILGKKYVEDLKANAEERIRVYKQKKRVSVLSFSVKKSKPLINEIDAELARYCGLNAEEEDWVRNFDIKYRMSGDGEEDHEADA
jgi:hypothetical protein